MAESSARYRALFESSPGRHCADRRNGRCGGRQSHLPAAGRTEPGCAGGRAFHRLLDDDSRADWNGPMREQLEAVATPTNSNSLLTVAGEPAAVATKCMRLADSRGVRRAAGALLRDLSERKQAGHRAAAGGRRVRQQLRRPFWSPTRISGVHGQSGLVQHTGQDTVTLAGSVLLLRARRDLRNSAMLNALQRDGRWQGEHWMSRGNGETFPVYCPARPRWATMARSATISPCSPTSASALPPSSACAIWPNTTSAHRPGQPLCLYAKGWRRGWTAPPRTAGGDVCRSGSLQADQRHDGP